MTAAEALEEIKNLVERRLTDPAEWYSVICAIREIVEEHHEK